MSPQNIISVSSEKGLYKIEKILRVLDELILVLHEKEILGVKIGVDTYRTITPELKPVCEELKLYFQEIRKYSLAYGYCFNTEDYFIQSLETVQEHQTQPLPKTLRTKLLAMVKPFNDLIFASEESPVFNQNQTDEGFSKTTPFKLVLKDKLIKPPEHPGYLLFKEILPKFIPDAYDDNSVFKTVAGNLGHSERVIFQMLTGLTSVNIIVALKLEAWLGKDVVCSKKLMALQTQYDLDAYRDKAQLKIVPFGSKIKPAGYSDEPYQSK